MYKEIEILDTDFEDKYLIRLHSKTMYVGFMVKEIIDFLKKGKKNVEIQAELNEKYGSAIAIEMIDDVILNKVNPFVSKNEVSSFKKIISLFDPSRISVPRWVLMVFEKKFFYVSGLLLLMVNSYFFYKFTYDHSGFNFKSVIAYFILLLVLLIHEIGHWLAAERYNSTVKEIGMGWYFFLPVLYVDLNDSWRLENKKRIIINLSGIYLQLICGFLLLFLSMVFPYWKTMLMMVFFMNFSIVLLNLNPFLKFDGYWVLSDLLDVKDLNAKSNKVVKNIFSWRKNDESKIVLLYSIFKSLFVVFVIVSLGRFFWMSLSKLYDTGNIELSGLFAYGFLMLFVFRMFKNKMNTSK